MSTTLTMQSPLPKRIAAYVIERFPPLNWAAFIIIYLCCSILGQASVAGDEGITLGVREAFGSLSSIAFFLLLRVLDEHKDYEKDMLHHPGRILMRGLITLKHLKFIGALCFLLIAAFCFYADQGFGHTFVGFLIVFGWVFLMTNEFFVAEWLNKHLVIYAVSHMLVMPLVMLWFVASALFTLTSTVLCLGAMAFFSGFCFEFTRKTKGPEEEIVGVDTYSSLLGRQTSSFIAWSMAALELVFKILLIQSLPVEADVSAYIILFVALALIVAGSFLAYLKNPSAKARKRNEMVAGLSTLISYGAVLTFVYRYFVIHIG